MISPAQHTRVAGVSIFGSTLTNVRTVLLYKRCRLKPTLPAPPGRSSQQQQPGFPLALYTVNTSVAAAAADAVTAAAAETVYTC